MFIEYWCEYVCYIGSIYPANVIFFRRKIRTSRTGHRRIHRCWNTHTTPVFPCVNFAKSAKRGDVSKLVYGINIISWRLITKQSKFVHSAWQPFQHIYSKPTASQATTKWPLIYSVWIQIAFRKHLLYILGIKLTCLANYNYFIVVTSTYACGQETNNNAAHSYQVIYKPMHGCNKPCIHFKVSSTNVIDNHKTTMMMHEGNSRMCNKPKRTEDSPSC